ncbi:hypothetical protein [Diaminobutyricimonas sp. LJ205]|uniref:hypothetical protein n=1 Tax=Diaminobutyricimonas sp. LJ205 TaxID=2683590 RepID=UPI0012F4A2B4|nr:hypothetical protein [Diaminobutyricimonas sp. LJ205]
MPQVFSHHRPAPARSTCAALTISISSTMTISSLIGVAQQVGVERQRAFVVAPREIIFGCMNCNKLVRLRIRGTVRAGTPVAKAIDNGPALSSFPLKVPAKG